MNRLKERREALGLTQPQLAKRLGLAGTDLHISMLSRFERGRCNPTPKQANAISGALQAPLTDLYDREDLDYHLPPKAKAEHRKTPQRIVGRLTLEEEENFMWAMEIMGHATRNEAVRYMIKSYIEEAGVWEELHER